MEIGEIKKIIVDQKEEIILTNPRRLSNEKQGSAKQVLILRLDVVLFLCDFIPNSS